jgi:Immunity protein Imm6
MFVLEDVLALAIRARVTFVTVCASRTVSALAPMPEIQTYAQKALQNCWKWQTQQSPTAHELYPTIEKLFEFEHLVKENEKQLAALFAVLTALYYTTAQAYDAQYRISGTVNNPLLPEDMAEIGDDDVLHGAEYALKASDHPEAEASWQQRTFQRLMTDFKAKSADDLGEPVRLEYFHE